MPSAVCDPYDARCRPHAAQWFTPSDSATEYVLHDIALSQEFSDLTLGQHLPSELTVFRFRHLLEKRDLTD